jgi:hypothetical protein
MRIEKENGTNPPFRLLCGLESVLHYKYEGSGNETAPVSETYLFEEDWKMPKAQVTDHDFVVAFQRGESHSAIADSLGVTVQTVYSRAKRLREGGVNLKVFPDGRGRKPIGDRAPGLNALIAELATQQPAS